MSVEAEAGFRPQRLRHWRRAVSLRLRRVTRALSTRLASSLTRRIIVLNLGGLCALLVGFLYLNQFRASLIDARVQSLQAQGEIIAAAVAASATVETDSITIDPEKLLQLLPGQSFGVTDEAESPLEFSINPERIGPVLRRLVSPTQTRARIYDRDGYLVVDSRSFNTRASIERSDLSAGNDANPVAGWLERMWDRLRGLMGQNNLPLFEDIGVANGRAYPEVVKALAGGAQSMVRVNARGQTIVSIAVPVQRFRTVRGALWLSTQGGDIDRAITVERWQIIRIFLVSAGVMFLISLFFAGTIAEPMRRLAEGAERVRRGIKSRQEIPDFTSRADEIGHLSGALRDMTGALYNRIEAIESFAADVAHELKNPLTSLRSAVETLPIARTESARTRLLEIIKHDVRRLDRLITDISDASRLDAELARADTQPVDVARIAGAVAAMANEVTRDDGVSVVVSVAPADDNRDQANAWVIAGHDSRIGQVLTNLVDNARSFSPQGGVVRIGLRQAVGAGHTGLEQDGIEITVDDDGPGIPAHAFERIFERFYTDRPNHGFGQNSGLGLSISRQIVEAHGGAIAAQNRYVDVATGEPVTPDTVEPGHEPPAGLRVSGARFVIWLPRRL